MRKKTLALLGWLLFCTSAWADDGPGLPRDAGFTTLITTRLAIEGLTGDNQGNLYTTGRQPPAGENCPVWRIAANELKPKPVEVGFVEAPCSPSGITFDAKGDLFIADADRVLVLTPDPDKKPLAKVYATGVPGTNGLAFDRSGDLWTGDGTTGQGRVWRIPAEKPASSDRVGIEMFRVQPMANEVNLNAAGVGGVGRDVRSLPPGAITVTAISRNAQNTAGSQPLVANGIAFNHEGDMLIADTARGAIWKVEMYRDGSIRSPMNCDTTFTKNTLCLDNILVAHPYLEGADGIALDAAGNIWVDANERNAVAVVTRRGSVVEVFRNAPDNKTKLRNTGPLETPTSPFLLGDKFCTANSDGNRRDNSPATAGEIGGEGQDKGKISCMDQPLKVPGMRLPI
jgi:sugar lactone lactonase YvrE